MGAFVPRGSVNDRPKSCPTPTKSCWVSEPLANAMAEYTIKYDNHIDYARVYKCENNPGGRKGCGYYHLTTKVKEYT